YLTLPKLFNKPSPLSHTSQPADAAATTAPAATNEPEVVHLETSEDQAGNQLDANPTSGNKSKQFIPSSSSMKAFETSSAHLATDTCAGSFSEHADIFDSFEM